VDTPLAAPVVLAAGATYVITAHGNGVPDYWAENLPATFSYGTINQSVWDEGDVFPSGSGGPQWYLVDLRYATDVVSMPLNPGTTPNFSSGSWSGNLMVFQGGTNLLLQATAADGSGSSNPFNVQLGTLTLTITSVGGSVVISWPAAVTGFNLEQTYNLSGGPWTTVTNTQTVVGSNTVVTNSPTATATFYRLHKP
jgi:hypothetical protein